MPTKSGVLYCECRMVCYPLGKVLKRTLTPNLCACFSQGSCRSCSVIRPHGCLQIFHVGYAHRLCCAYPILVVATPVPGHSTEIYPLAYHAQRPHTRATRKRDQLRKLDHRWVYLPYVFIFFLFMPKKRKKSFHSLFYLSCWV